MTNLIARRALTAAALTAAASSAGLFALAGASFAAPTAPHGVIRDANITGAIKDHYIVVTKTAVDGTALAQKVGGTATERYTAAVTGFAATMSQTSAERLAADPSVAYVEQDRTLTIAATQANPPSWGLDRIDQTSLPLDHSYTAGTAAAVHAYIIDTGIRMTHTEYAGRVTSGYDFVDNDSDATDCQGHGTHVAGTVGGRTYGVAKDVQLVAVRVLDCSGSGSYSQIIAGVDWVTAHAVRPAVANMSLGGTAGTTIDNAVQKSIDSGITYAVAAGNDANDACTKSPARVAAAVTVGATDTTDAQASFSNYGTCVDIYAPGVNILSAANTSDTGTERMSGTSMATPHVTGAAALYLQTHPTASPQQVRDALVAAATTDKITGVPTSSPNKLLNVSTLTAGPTSPVTTPTDPPVTTPTGPTACAPVTNGFRRAIADKATIESKTTINCTGKASPTTTVKVNISHSDRGDLRLDLIAPNGTTYNLKTAKSTDKAANITATYTVNAAATDRTGTWKLRITDTATKHTGTLISWVLAA